MPVLDGKQYVRPDGLLIWAHSRCRSVMALYRELGTVTGLPVKILLWQGVPCDGGTRVRAGFRADEFSDMDIDFVGEDYGRGHAELLAHTGWIQLFCVYQKSPVFQRLILEAKEMGERVAVMCESPSNLSSGLRWIAKEMYLRFVLPLGVRKVVRAAECFVSYSGDDIRRARSAGWPKSKIVSFGYYPPPIEGSHCVARRFSREFHVLATGILSRYRGADVLVEALRILKQRGIDFKATITQDGELLQQLKNKAARYDLPIEFPGFVAMRDLVKLYETCSVYVGTGREEPWGMRLNDALNCGALLVVSRGMGGVSLVKQYNCGLDFPAGDAVRLADCLQRLSQDESFYNKCAQNVLTARRACQPRQKAVELASRLGFLAGERI